MVNEVGEEDPLLDDGERDRDAPINNQGIPDWRSEMRAEIQSAMAEFQNERPLNLPLGPSEIDPADVLESEPFVDVMRQIETGNRENKTAIRLAAITKEGLNICYNGNIECYLHS